MTTENTASAIELSELQLRLQADLDFTMQTYGGDKYYVVEDRTKSRFYQIGISEYVFLSLLDGNTTLTEALQLTSSRLGADAFTEQNAISITKWLLDSQLVTVGDSTETERLIEQASKAERQSRISRLNPLLVRIPIFNPERMLDVLTPWFGWLISRQAVVALFVLCGLAIHQLLGKSNELGLAANGVFDRNNWAWLAATWIGLKFFHELAHALTCRKFGGHVRDCGLMLILFAPIPYVDVTSSWRFPSKWQRIATSGAGMFFELALAAAAVLVWSHSDNPVLKNHAYNVMLLGSITTVAFNANFLMRFDGYYMLADWLEIPNLHSLGQQYLSYFGRRYALGVKLDPPRWRKLTLIRLYGVASLAWRVFVCVCLTIAAEAFFFGFGLLLSVAAVVLWLGVPMIRLVRYLIKGKDTERPNVWRFATINVIGSAMLIAAFTVIPWPARVSAPAIVQYADPVVVHTEVPGIVRTVYVEPGQNVRAGDPLIELVNPDLNARLREIELSIEQSKARSRQYHLRGQLGAYQAEASTLQALDSKLGEMRHQLAALLVYAPQDGKVVARNLNTLVGRYLPMGTKLLTIASEDNKEVVVSIHQDDIPYFRSQVGYRVTVCVAPPLDLDCQLDRVEPRASSEVVHAALIAPASGPIPVRSMTSGSATNGDSWQYVHPRFGGQIQLPTSDAEKLRAGQSASVKLATRHGTLGGHLCRIVRDWLRARLSRAALVG